MHKLVIRKYGRIVIIYQTKGNVLPRFIEACSIGKPVYIAEHKKSFSVFFTDGKYSELFTMDNKYKNILSNGRE